MMSPLERAIVLRNARLRAWRDFGVPVLGEWRKDGGAVALRVACEACGRGTIGRQSLSRLAGGDSSPSWYRVLAEEEQDAFRCAPFPAPRLNNCCPHLFPMCDHDPPDFAAFVALALLEAP
jgi:hypothetical protein